MGLTFMRFVVFALLALASGPLVSEDIYNSVFRGGSSPVTAAPCELGIVSWNIERGLKLPGVEKALREMNPGLIFLQEVDVGARRTGRVHVAETLAQSLSMNYLFATEFEELGQGNRDKPAYHGQAFLTQFRIESARILRLKNQSGFWKPRWFIPNWGVFQRRNGGRIALIIEMTAGSQRVVAYSVHLEGRSNEELRLLQAREIISDARRYPETTPVIVAGDFNTRIMNAPAVKAMLEAGFREAAGGGGTNKDGLPLDWIFVRGPLEAREGMIHRQVHASDHFPLSAHIKIKSPECGSTARQKNTTGWKLTDHESRITINVASHPAYGRLERAGTNANRRN